MLKKDFEEKYRQDLLQDLKLDNFWRVPTLEKVVVSLGVGSRKENEAFIAEAVEELRQITGQAPVIRKSRKAVAGFKLRAGEVVGLQVTLRGERMWDFLEKLIRVALPRVRDFRGVSLSSFDGRGNYNLGIEEHQVFPEIDANKMKWSKSLQVTLATPASVTDAEAEVLLRKLGLPFEK